IDYFKLGQETGLMAAKILKGEAKASEMPYETIIEYSFYINADAIADMQLTTPSDLEVIEVG
ncbi:MAG: ABC transporter substrate-binding protein, partial [Clostridia bacterium]|nr:ABC transporter substrate-binding protein [Clostridia bacterium]